MKTYFRKVNGKQTVFAEIYGTFYRLNTVEHTSSLPGDPLAWGEVNNRLKGRLSVMHFLEVTADQDAAEGEAILRLPDPETLWKWTDSETWKRALAKVEALADTSDEFQAFAHWWEYLRRSDAYRRDCEAMREHSSADLGLTWAAFAGWTEGLSLAGSATRTTREIAFYAKYAHGFSDPVHREANRKILEIFAPSGWAEDPDITPYIFRQRWNIPEGGAFPLLWPKRTNSKAVAASFLALNRGLDTFFKLVLPPTGEEVTDLETRLICQLAASDNAERPNLRFLFPCDLEKASCIITELFISRLPVIDFIIEEIFRFGTTGIDFIIDTSREGEEEAKKGFPSLKEHVQETISEAVGIELPTLKTWGSRRRLDPLKLKRELAAFDKDATLDAELWPGVTGESLSADKSRARSKARKRIAQLEKAAKKRHARLKHNENLEKNATKKANERGACT